MRVVRSSDMATGISYNLRYDMKITNGCEEPLELSEFKVLTDLFQFSLRKYERV